LDVLKCRLKVLSLEALRNAEPGLRLASLTEPDRTRRLIEERCPEEAASLVARADSVLGADIELLGVPWETAIMIDRSL
jgi:hypothetical protein